MKKLSKIVALLLAGAMAMLMFTACSGGGGSSNLKEDPDAEAKVLGKYSTSTTSVDNNKALKAEAEKFLDEKINASVGIGGYKFVLGGDVKGQKDAYLTVIVAANFSYNDTLLSGILNEISKKVNTDTNVDIKQNGAWTDIGVVVKGDSKNSYMAVAFKIKNPNYKG